MKRSFKTALLPLALIVCLSGGGLVRAEAHANSAQSYWSGRDAFGAYVKEENCPVTVTGEKLTLRVPDFPQNHYADLEEFLCYKANVTAEYTFHNPATYDVDMTLVFPFGRRPDYLYDFYDEEGDRVEVDDTAGYLITADGEEVPRTVRHTLDRWTGDPAKDIPRLSETKRTSGTFSFDTPVTVFFYRQIATQATSPTSFIAASFKNLGNAERTKIMLEGLSGYDSAEERAGRWGQGYGDVFRLYVIGEPLSGTPEWKVYENASCKKLTEGTVERVPEEKLPTEQTTLGALIMGKYEAERGVSEVDWFNAAFDELMEDETGIVLKSTPGELNVFERLMRWYEYDLSIPAGGSVVNSVTAPLYPSIDLGYYPPICSYTYLLSPASTWAEFGSFELCLETPYYVTAGSLRFEKGENGYTYSQQGLPEGELTFTLSTQEDPVRQSHFKENAKFFLTYFWWLLLIPLLLLIGVAVLIVVLVRKKKKKS